MTSHLTRRSFAAGAGLLAAAPLLARADEAGPIRYVSFVSRAAGLSREDFLKKFHAQGAKAARLPFSLVVFSDVIPASGPAGRAPQLDSDGMIELWVPSEAHYDRIRKSAAGRAWIAATNALLAKNTTYVCKEHVFTAVPQRDGQVKTLTLIVRKDGWSHAQYMEHWLGTHGPMATKVPGLIGFVLTEIVKTDTPKGELLMPECDGIAELWWDPVKGQPPGTMVNTAGMRTWGADGNVFIQREKSRNLVLEGHVYA